MIVFAAFAVLGAINGFYLDRISRQSTEMMRYNYRSLNYTHEMSLALEDVISVMTLEETSYLFKRTKLREAFDKFERYMILQDKNIADTDEEEVTIQLREAFEDFRNKTETAFRKDGKFDIPIHMQTVNIRGLLNQVYSRNKEIIENKTQETNEIINRATLYIIIFGFTSFLLAIIAMFYLPDFFARPIKEMTDSMERVARREYSERLPVSSNDEFGNMAESFNIMASKLEEYEAYNVKQLMSEKTRIETLISRMKSGIIGVDNNGTLLFANPVAERLLGKKEEEIINTNINDYDDEFFKELTQELREKSVREERNYPNLKVIKNGQTLFFSKDIFSVKINEGEKEADYGWVIVLKNVTKLTQENLAKTNFMARLSHELKTPIAAIDMSTNLLKDDRIGTINDEQKDLLNTVNQNTGRMLTMVNELIDMAKIESGNIKLDIKSTAPDDVINYALKAVKTFIDEKKIKIIRNVEVDLPNIQLDPLRTGDVLVNYLTNAIRYTKKGGTIDINVTGLVDAVSFSVRDYANGIEPKELEKVFQKFARSKGDKTKGTGLGLAISKEFIEAQGGSVWANSTIGEGSTFGFNLPIIQ